MTVTELRREAARLDISGRSKMGKAQLIRAVAQKRRASKWTSAVTSPIHQRLSGQFTNDCQASRVGNEPLG